MARACTACTSPHRDDLDARLVANREAYRAVAERYGLSRDAVWRHARNHLPGEDIRGGRRTSGQLPPGDVAKAAEVAELARTGDWLAEVVERLDRLERQDVAKFDRVEEVARAILAKAIEQRSWGHSLGAIREWRAVLELVARERRATVELAARLRGHLDDRARVEVNATALAAAVQVDVSEESLGRAIAMALAAQGGGGVADVSLPVTAPRAMAEPSHWRSREEEGQERPRRRRGVLDDVDDYAAAAAPLRALRLPVC